MRGEKMNSLGNGQTLGEYKFCSFCDNEAIATVKVSVDSYADEERPVCASCKEAYEVGVQHGIFAAAHKVRSAEASPEH